MPAVIFILLLVLSFLIIKPLLLALLLGALLAYIFFPVYTWLRKKISLEGISALLVCIAVLLLLLIPGVFLVKVLLHESYTLFLTAKQQISGESVERILNGCSAEVCSSLRSVAQDPEVAYYVQGILKSATRVVLEKGSAFLMSIPTIILNLFVIFFTMFYFLKGGEKLLYSLNAYLSMHHAKYSLILRRLQDIVRGVVFGYGVVALMQGALGALGFFLFGISSPLFWGMIMTVLALIPFLGTGFVWVPAAVYLFLQGMHQDSTYLMMKGIGLAVYSFIFVSTLDNFIRPKLISEKARIHPVVVMIGIFGGLLFFGPIGLIVGPLVLCLTMVFLEVYLLGKVDGEKVRLGRG